MATSIVERIKPLQEKLSTSVAHIPGFAGGETANVGASERAASLVGGALLGLIGLKRRDTLGVAMLAAGAGLVYRASSGYCPAYGVLGIRTNDRPAAPKEYDESGIHVTHSVTIDRPRAELFAFWRNFENLPRFMDHLNEVKVLDGNRSHWVAKAPAGRSVAWDAEIINEVQDEVIAWRSLGGADVDNAGSVRFIDAPANRGTVVKVTIDYIPPAGVVGKWVATLFGEEPKQQIREDLRRFKRLMETGEIATTEGQSQGTCDA